MAAAASCPPLLLGAAVLLAWASAPRGAATLSEVVAETGDPEFVLSGDDECVLGDSRGAADSSGASACAMHALQLRARPTGVGGAPPPNGTGGAAPAHEDNSTVLSTSPLDLVVTTYDELKFAVDSLKTGGVIEVAKGSVITFDGTLNIDEGTNFKIWSHGATLDGKNAYGQLRMFYVRGQLTLLGFLIRNGKTDYAGAMYFDFNSTGNITKCNFVDNQATYMGGAIAAKGANLQMTEVNFKDNKADNTCLSELHCSRRRRNDRAGNAVYIMSHTVLQAAIPKQQASQDFYFDKDFDGKAAFCGDKPALKATTPQATKEFVKTVNVDNGVCAF